MPATCAAPCTPKPTESLPLSGSTASGLAFASAANVTGSAADCSRQPADGWPGADDGADAAEGTASGAGEDGAGADDASDGAVGVGPLAGGLTGVGAARVGAGGVSCVAEDDGAGGASGDGVTVTAPGPPAGARLVSIRAHDPSGCR